MPAKTAPAKKTPAKTAKKPTTPAPRKVGTSTFPKGKKTIAKESVKKTVKPSPKQPAKQVQPKKSAPAPKQVPQKKKIPEQPVEPAVELSPEEQFYLRFKGNSEAFEKYCETWLSRRKTQYGDPKINTEKNRGGIDILSFKREITYENFITNIFYISVLNKKTVGAPAVEKIASAMEKKLLKVSQRESTGHQAVIMTSGSFSLEAQKAAVSAYVLLISAKTLMK